MTLPIA
jgi:hypothetical protein